MIVYNYKVTPGYITQRACHKTTSQRREPKRLTRQNRLFLQSLGLKLHR